VRRISSVCRCRPSHLQALPLLGSPLRFGLSGGLFWLRVIGSLLRSFVCRLNAGGDDLVSALPVDRRRVLAVEWAARHLVWTGSGEDVAALESQQGDAQRRSGERQQDGDPGDVHAARLEGSLRS
jgi:hypothetical protein